MIPCAAATYRVFFQFPQARRCLARVQDRNFAVRNRLDVPARVGRDARKIPQKIKRRPLSRQKRPGLPFHKQDGRILFYFLAFGAAEITSDVFVQFLKNPLDNGQAADNGGFFHNDLRA